MEPARSTGNFNRRITVADSNNIIAILDMNAINSKYQIFEKDYLVEFQSVLEDLKVTVGLLGLAEAPWPNVNALMNESEKMAEIARIRTQGQKIGLGLYTAIDNGPWQYESEVVLQNQGGAETHVPILVPFLSSNETLLIAGNFKLGVKIEPKWNQPLKANDYLVIKGTWRQVVSFSKKKDDDLDALNARISALELALEGRLVNLPANTLLGKGAAPGTVEVIPRSTFATPAQVTAAIANLVNTAPLALDTLNELAAALGNDANFASTTTNQLALKAPLSALANYYPKGSYTSLNPDNFVSGIEGADRNLGEGLAGWHFFTNLRSTSSTYGIQLALSDTFSSPYKIKFRAKFNGVWLPWSNLTFS